MDVGLRATKTGSKVFAVMKGAADGGLHVPHSPSRLPGFKEGEENKALRSRILGGHVDSYMKKLKGTEKASLQFSKWQQTLTAAGVASVEKLYEKIHAEIRKNPAFSKKVSKANPGRDHKKYSRARLNAAQRRQNIKKRI